MAHQLEQMAYVGDVEEIQRFNQFRQQSLTQTSPRNA